MTHKIDIKIRTKTSLGIDISSTSVALAWLKQDKHGTHLLHAVRRPMPKGLLKGGVIEDPKRLRRLICDLKRKCGPTRVTALSLFSPRSMVQILDVPNHVSMNLGPYVLKEIRDYVNLAGVKTVSDYRCLESSGESRRVFVAVGDHKNVACAVNVCQATGLDVQTVEPNLAACARVLYDRTLAPQTGCNVMMAILRDGQVCLAVWQDRVLHFIRCHTLDTVTDEPEQLGAFLASKITMIRQYFDVEVPECTDAWRLNVVTDDASLFPEQARTALCEALDEIPVDVITPENLDIYCTVDMPKKISRDQISIGAVGHAMQSLCQHPGVPRVNLLPMQIREEKVVRQGMLLTAIAASVLLLFSAMLVMGLAVRTEHVKYRIAMKKPGIAVGKIVQERGDVELQIEQVGKIPTVLKSILQSQKNVNWSGVLSDIKNTRPKGVCLTCLDTRNNTEVFIQGKALTYGDVTAYVTRLGQAAHIDSANLTKTDHKSGYNSYHVYEIKCQLKTTTGI